MAKTGLIIEGGGLRGAYTAGTLAWLLDHDIAFDYGVGISIGALYLAAYMTKNKELLRDCAIELAAGSDNVGLKPLLREGTLVGYEKVFRSVVNHRHKLDLDVLRNSRSKAEIGVYDLDKGETVWMTNDDLDDDCLLIKAACTLPMFGKKVRYNGKNYIDGGVTTMIPIGRSLANDIDKHFVITTKSADYVRKPYNIWIQLLFKLVYHSYPKLSEDIKKRADNYYREVDQVKELVKKKKGFYVYPTKEIGVTRFGGTKEQLIALYDLGYQDMEKRKEEILAFLDIHGE